MINKSCVSCNKPMNGGVYRKPNQCPHCLSLQDESLTVDCKPVKTQGADSIPKPVIALVQTEKEVVLTPEEEMDQEGIYLETDADLDRREYIVTELEEDDEILVEEDASEEFTSRVLEFPAVASEEESTDMIVTVQDDVSESQAVVEASAVPPEYANVRHFDNLETTPDLDESLDVALDMASVASGDIATRAMPEKNMKASENTVESEELIVLGDKVVALSERAGALRNESASNSPAEPQKPATPVAPVGENEDKSFASPAEYEAVVLTTESAQNVSIAKRLDIVSAECVFGTDMVKSNLSAMNQLSKIEHVAPPNVLKDARKTVLDEIKKEAFLLGANTVVEVKLDYSEISRGESAMMMVVATGTAVKAA